MNLEIFKTTDPSGRMSKESFLIKNHKEEYDYIIDYSINNKILDISFREKVYLCLNNLKKIPVCKNPNCNKRVEFRNSTLGYREYCSTKCISSDPNIKKLKEENSIKKFGTKSPAQSQEVKDKSNMTNQERYGHNSAMCLKETQEKSKQTLIKNWGVDNPNKSSELILKRIKSFRNNIDQYKESYKKTSLERYGVEHPWMNSDVHFKTIEFFYKDYRKRIEEKISSDFKFIGFEKEKSTNLSFHCNCCNSDFKILTYQFYYRINGGVSICTNCFPISENSSIVQIELYQYILENYKGEIITDYKKVISPYEIDVYLPELKIGFEFNGVWWHSDKFKDNDHHNKKQKISEINGIKLYSIWEDDWNVKREICKSFIINKLGKTPNRLMARKCEVKEISYNDSRNFLNNNHLQGDCKSSIRIGLFYSDILVSLMTFSRLRLPLGGTNKEGVYELTRFCNLINTSVVGGASKILKYFVDKYNPISIETYSDNLISSGDIYEKIGFKYSHTSKPGYWYLIDGVREHRFNWRKSKLIKMGYDKNKTEEEIMLELGYYRIYNAGNRKWIYQNNI